MQFATDYVDSQIFADEIGRFDDLYSNLVKSSVAKFNETNVDRQRNLILMKCFPDQTQECASDDWISIDCDTAMDYMFRKICEISDGVNSIVQSNYCEECCTESYKISRPYFPIDLKNLDIKNIVTAFKSRTRGLHG